MLKKIKIHPRPHPFPFAALKQARAKTHSTQPPLHLFYLITRARTPALCMLQQRCLPTIYLRMRTRATAIVHYIYRQKYKLCIRMRAQATAKATKKHTPNHPIYLRLRARATAKTTKKHLSPFTPHHHILKPSHAPHLTTLSTPKHDCRLIATRFARFRTVNLLSG